MSCTTTHASVHVKDGEINPQANASRYAYARVELDSGSDSLVIFFAKRDQVQALAAELQLYLDTHPRDLCKTCGGRGEYRAGETTHVCECSR